MELSYCQINHKHRRDVLNILSYYMTESFSAIRSESPGDEYFDFLLELTKNYPSIACVNEHDELFGFSFLRAYHPAQTVERTAIITIFIKPGLTRQGIGSNLMTRIISQARNSGIRNILADVISHNHESIEFHKKHGFEVCGQYHNIGSKLGQNFDMLLMQWQDSK